jgi:hypothetical protein
MSQQRPVLRLGQPIWLRSLSKPKPTYPSLTGHRQSDVAIVGGGITGAPIAHAFATAGISVAVVEGDLVARGSTAASSALLLQEPDQGLLQLAERYGTHAGRRIWQLSHEAVRDLVGLLRRLHIQCDLRKRDVIYYATQADGVERLRREFLVRKKAGFEAEWLTPGPLRRMTGIPGRGAIRSRGSAQFNPYRACLGVLRAAVVAGAEIFERSFVTRIDAGRDRVRIHTRNARIDARRRGDRHRICHPSFSSIGRPISDVSDLRPGDAAAECLSTARARSIRHHDLGYQASVSLRPVD